MWIDIAIMKEAVFGIYTDVEQSQDKYAAIQDSRDRE